MCARVRERVLVCVCVCARECVRACLRVRARARVCVCVCVYPHANVSARAYCLVMCVAMKQCKTTLRVIDAVQCSSCTLVSRKLGHDTLDH